MESMLRFNQFLLSISVLHFCVLIIGSTYSPPKVMPTRKQLFISYRRKSWGHATQLRDNLARLLDADIFMDFTSIDQDEFETAILAHLQASDVVLVVVTEHTFAPDRIHRDDDWVRREIREALNLKKPIALACIDGLFPPADLPDDIRAVRNKEGKRLFAEFFEAGCHLLAAHIATIGSIPFRNAVPSPTDPVMPAAPSFSSVESRRAKIESLMESSDYAQAVFELESLLESGFKSTKYWSAEAILAEATQLRDESAHHDQMMRDYAEIVSMERLAKSARLRQQVADAWQQFISDYPEFDDALDMSGLLKKLTLAIATPSVVQPTITAEQQHFLDIMLDTEHYSPIQRAEAGRQLAEIGDPRPGVGLRPDGLPDLLWCEVPAGTCQLGAKEDSDNPPRTVDLARFWITKYPITYRQFQAFLDAPDGYNNVAWWQGIYSDAIQRQPAEAMAQAYTYWNHPRDNVSWYEAMAFCAWLSTKIAMQITLPTEEQWEKAARGTDGRIYSFAQTFDANLANTKETDIRLTSAAGIFPADSLPYGIFDMCGNVWEWCINNYQSGEIDMYSEGAKGLRGGSWSYSQDTARAAYRNRFYPHDRNKDVGFRVVTESPPLLPPES